MRKLVAGNWKMHGVAADLAQVRAIADASRDFPSVDVALCVPATLIERAARAVPGFAIGAQDVHEASHGAYTGCVSAQMLLDAGASLTIVGHSERREFQRESDAESPRPAEPFAEKNQPNRHQQHCRCDVHDQAAGRDIPAGSIHI